MWNAMNPDGSLAYSFMETMIEMYPYWWARAFGGIIYLLGVLIFIYNMYKSVSKGETSPVPELVAAEGRA